MAVLKSTVCLVPFRTLKLEKIKRRLVLMRAGFALADNEAFSLAGAVREQVAARFQISQRARDGGAGGTGRRSQLRVSEPYVHQCACRVRLTKLFGQ